MPRYLVGSLSLLLAMPAVGQTAPTPPATPQSAPGIPSPPATAPMFAPPRAAPSFLPAPSSDFSAAFRSPASVRYVDLYQRTERSSRCLVQRVPQGGQEFWTTRPGSLPERRTLTLWSRRGAGCYAAGLVAPVSLLRGALAEAELQATSQVSADRATPQRMAAFISAEATRRRASAQDDRIVSALASCVAPLAFTQIKTLLAIPHGDPTERQALNRVLANGSSCVRGDWRLPDWAGTTFLRAYLAEAAYRWSRFNAAG